MVTESSNLPPLVRERSWWASGPGLLLVAAILTSAWAWWLIAYPVVSLGNVAKHPGHFPVVFVHMAGGTLMLLLGAVNLYVGSTRRYFRFHRRIGYVYLLAGTVGSLLAAVLAVGAGHGEKVPGFAFVLEATSDVGWALLFLALAWLGSAAMAYRAARNRRIDSHRAWMIRGYVLTWSFVSCRLVARVPALANLGDGAAIVWLSWIVPLLLCEVVLQWSAGARLARVAPRAQAQDEKIQTREQASDAKAVTDPPVATL